MSEAGEPHAGGTEAADDREPTRASIDDTGEAAPAEADPETDADLEDAGAAEADGGPVRARRSPLGWLTARTSSWTREDVLRTVLPQVLFAVLLIVYTAVMYHLVWQRHEHFGSFDYDLGMYDQGIWQLAHGRGFMTVRGMHVFGHHANLGYLLFVPFYWLGAGPHFLNLVNTLGVVACAIPLYAMGRKGLRSDWAGLLIAIAYLFHYVPQWMIQETFHPENLAAPFIIGAFWFATEGRWRAYWICLFAALVWKEDVALVVAMLGIVVGFITWEVRRATLTVLTAAVWFVIAVKGIIPFFSPDGAVFDGLFPPELGDSATDVVATGIRDPSTVGRILQEHDAEGRAFDLMRPYAFTAMASPHVLLLGVPQHVVNLLSAQSFTWETKFHYAMFPFVAVTLASVRTAITRRRRAIGWLLVIAMVGGVWLTRDQGVGPWAAPSKQGFWPGEDPVVNPAYREAMAKVPPEAVVSAPYMVVPHLSHREEIYTFPNPWRSSNFGPGVRPLTRDPDRVDVLIIRPEVLGESDRVVYDEVVASGQLTRVWAEGGVELWARPGFRLYDR